MGNNLFLGYPIASPSPAKRPISQASLLPHQPIVQYNRLHQKGPPLVRYHSDLERRQCMGSPWVRGCGEVGRARLTRSIVSVRHNRGNIITGCHLEHTIGRTSISHDRIGVACSRV